MDIKIFYREIGDKSWKELTDLYFFEEVGIHNFSEEEVRQAGYEIMIEPALLQTRSRREVIKLEYETLIAILQGKEIHLQTDFLYLVLKPPFDGVFLTHEELRNIRIQTELNTIDTLNNIQKYVQRKKD